MKQCHNDVTSHLEISCCFGEIFVLLQSLYEPFEELKNGTQGKLTMHYIWGDPCSLWSLIDFQLYEMTHQKMQELQQLSMSWIEVSYLALSNHFKILFQSCNRFSF